MISIIPFAKKHIKEVVELEKRTFANPWSEMFFEKELKKKNVYYIIVMKANKIVGYTGIWYVFEEGHVMNIVVESSSRNQGIGKQLIRHLITKSKELGLLGLTLEVRENNITAYNLYKSLGFVEVGIRKDYYKKPTEDGIIMWNYF